VELVLDVMGHEHFVAETLGSLKAVLVEGHRVRGRIRGVQRGVRLFLTLLRRPGLG